MPTGSPTLSLTDWVVLALVAEAPRHGFAVAKEVAADAALGEVWTVPRPLVYRVTRSGSARVARWLDQPVAHPREVRTELLVKLMLRSRRGRPLTPLAQRQLERFAPMTDGLEQRARAADGADRVVARWRVESIGAIRRTLEAIVADET